ncbi:DUF4381 domain-containing protein [Photobacterium lutimaris]|uniref:DUF4381 domain-containing protein n=1 Tax=Photobacterium lutimaris TaxID=388278 RepID=UPI0010D06B0F|nr:DUF4381 domain-containing protein [Photobacterium lutimaris]TDR76146.1 uncharacterized protein DUF4381 [Photobacterium lutimaris]
MDSGLNLAPLDIPAEPSWWPLPLSAWLILGAMAVLVLGWSLYRYLKGRLRRKALMLLDTLESEPNLPALDRLLRRVALTYYPRDQIAGLTGDAWLKWLDRQNATPLFLPLQSQWSAGLYRGQPIDPSDWDAFITASRSWIMQCQPEGR